MNWFKRLFRRQYKAWALKDDRGCWHKVVSYRKPNNCYSWYTQGPFRSEVEAEEFVDRANLVRTQNRVSFYSKELHKAVSQLNSENDS